MSGRLQHHTLCCILPGFDSNPMWVHIYARSHAHRQAEQCSGQHLTAFWDHSHQMAFVEFARNVGEATHRIVIRTDGALGRAFDGCMTVRITPKCTLTAANAECPVTPASTSLSPSPSPPPPPSSLANTIQSTLTSRDREPSARLDSASLTFTGRYHNLHSLPSKAAYDSGELARPPARRRWPQPGGVVVTVTSATEQFFARRSVRSTITRCTSALTVPSATPHADCPRLLGASSATAQQSAGSPAQTRDAAASSPASAADLELDIFWTTPRWSLWHYGHY